MLVTLNVTIAFNTTCHIIIISELRTRRISQYLLELIANYFMDQYSIQIDKIENAAVNVELHVASVLGRCFGISYVS